MEKLKNRIHNDSNGLGGLCSDRGLLHTDQKRLQDLMLMIRHSDEQESKVHTFIK